MSNNNIENTTKEKKTLEYMSAKDLQDKDIPAPNIIVQNMLYQGLSVIASQPKIGKSWLSLDLAICVATGQDFLGNKTEQGDCLYLALEDSYHRLKSRLNLILGDKKAPDNLFVATLSKGLENGLLEQLNEFIISYPNTKLIIIDTLQKVRGNMKFNESAYSNDYKEVGKLKAFADQHNIAILLVHHLRKAKDKEDVFNQISGTNGIAGASDTMIVLSKKNRTSAETLFSITGRDVEGDEKIIIFDKNIYKWKTLHTQEELKQMQELSSYTNNPIVITIKELLKDNPKGIKITSTELLKQIQEITGVLPKQNTPATLSRYINTTLRYKLQEKDNICYFPPPQNGGSGGRKLYFSIPSREL